MRRFVRSLIQNATHAGDVITVISHGFLHDGQTLAHKARVVTAGPKNEVVSIGEQS
ncbi:MAG TPA: hypothetical protein VF505_06285 [Thermoanaerobaculia bacterium]